MSFQSILYREGWNSPRLITKALCQTCLSRRISPTILNIRQIHTTHKTLFNLVYINNNNDKKSWASEENIQNSNQILTMFRNELYQRVKHSDKNLEEYSSNVRKVIKRRHTRQRLLHLYRLMKKQQPLLLSQLSQQDVDLFISKFSDVNPDSPASHKPIMDALQILQDLKKGYLFKNATFNLNHVEKMIYLTAELNRTKEAEDLLTEALVNEFDVSISSFEAVIRTLCQEMNGIRIDYWLEELKNRGCSYSRSMTRSVVMYHLSQGHFEEAVQFIKYCHGNQELSHLINRYADSRELMDNALTLFAKDAMLEWRLNEMRNIYLQKRYFGLSTPSLMKLLVDKCLYSGQLSTAHTALNNALYMKDGSSARLCSKKLIQWYLSHKNIKYAMKVWETMEKDNVKVTAELMSLMLDQASKMGYHRDALKLYQRCKELVYPISFEAQIHLLRCLVRFRKYEEAESISHEIEKSIPEMKPLDAKSAVAALFQFCAQTGQIDFFEKILNHSETMNLSLTHEGLTSLIACYLKVGDTVSAKKAFQTVTAHTNGPDVVDFNLLMRIIAMEAGENTHDKILDVLKHMKMVNVTPDVSTLRTMAKFYKTDSNMQNQLFKQLINLPASSNSDQIMVNNIALINLLDRKNPDYVCRLFLDNDRGALFPSEKGKPIARNGITYQLLLNATTNEIQYSHIAIRLFKDMRSRGLKPDRETYEHMILMYSRKGRIKKVREIIHLMEQETGEKATVRTYTKLVDGLLRLKKLEFAKEVITTDIANANVELDQPLLDRLEYINQQLSAGNRVDQSTTQ
ncbi:hypothetical protein BDB01DRAFT_779245 [Pilobolus umbonatus]|nr:hypothetical protein BDB01DRAFT_779245 [Pilobolus umbonatus]